MRSPVQAAPGLPPAALASRTPAMTAILTIGTRGSPLALAQAAEVRARLAAAHPALCEPDALAIEVIRTTGDTVQDRPLSEIGGKGLFTKEIEDALFDRRIDIAVHSMKDVATVLPAGLGIVAILPREDPRDAFIGATTRTLSELKSGARVGTSSLRRAAQLKAWRQDLAIVPFRGNIDTRVARLKAGEADATLLAMAGLNRLKRTAIRAEALPPEVMLPAVAQGAIGVEARLDDQRAIAFLAAIDDPPSHTRVRAERALLAALDGSCRTPIAALAMIGPADDHLSLDALVAMPDGSEVVRTKRAGSKDDAERMGRDAGLELLSRIGPGFRI